MKDLHFEGLDLYEEEKPAINGAEHTATNKKYIIIVHMLKPLLLVMLIIKILKSLKSSCKSANGF